MLTTEQAAFFARNGFLQLPRLVPEASCRHLVERSWSWLPSHWRRDDPASWRGQVSDSCHVADLDFRGGHMKFQHQELASDASVVASFENPSPGHAAALDLIGQPLCPIRLRGLYVIAPVEHPERAKRTPAAHVEAHPVHIVALAYLDDVEPGGGGLLVWPGSHRDLWRAFDSKLEYVATPRFAERLAHYKGLQPVELPGTRGDVILTHHRLLHAPSLNRSTRIRFAFLCDYTAVGCESLCQQAPGPDLWEDWPGVARIAGRDACAAGPDYVMPPVAPPPRLSPFARVWRWLANLGSRTAATTSSRNKSDASRIAREKRPGDVWLSVSDTPARFDHTDSLDPHGSDLQALGIVASLHGERIVSRSCSDITAPLAVRDGRNVLVLEGAARPLWVRIVEIRLPFRESVTLVRRVLDGREPRVEIGFDWRRSAIPCSRADSA